ncbi:unnamed protein product, partial [Prorocentrum cordatum]
GSRPPPPLPHWARRRRSRRASRAPACRGSSGEVARRRKGRRAAGSEATRHPGKCMHSARHPGTSPPAAGEGVPRPRLPRAVWRTTSSRLFRIGVALRGGRRMGRGRGRRRRGGCDLLLHSPPRGRRALAPARPRGRCCHTASSPGSGRHLPLGGVARSRWRRRGCIVRVLLSRSGAARPVPLGAAAAHGLLPVRTGGETVRARRAARRAARLPRPDCLGLGQRHRSASADGGRKFQDGCARKTGREREREKKIKHKNKKKKKKKSTRDTDRKAFGAPRGHLRGSAL